MQWPLVNPDGILLLAEQAQAGNGSFRKKDSLNDEFQQKKNVYTLRFSIHFYIFYRFIYIIYSCNFSVIYLLIYMYTHPISLYLLNSEILFLFACVQLGFSGRRRIYGGWNGSGGH